MEIKRPTSKQPMPEHAKCVFKGVMFDTWQWEQEMYDGSTATFEKLVRPDTVVVFPVLPDGKILLTHQDQPGRTEPFYGGAGGRVDPGEDILAAAKRELLEETGYKAEEFILWDAQQPTTKIDWAVFTFVAKGCTKAADLSLDPGEKIELKPVSFDEFLELGTTEKFMEKEIVNTLYEARLDSEKKRELQELFKV